MGHCAKHNHNFAQTCIHCAAGKKQQPLYKMPVIPPLTGIDGAWDNPPNSDPIKMPATPVQSTLADPLKSQVGGSHYTRMKIQPMVYAMANNFNALQFTVLKYISRYEHKNGLEDLMKARHALDMLIDHYKKEHPNAV